MCNKKENQGVFIPSGRSFGALRNLGSDGLLTTACEIESEAPGLENPEEALIQAERLFNIALFVEKEEFSK